MQATIQKVRTCEEPTAIRGYRTLRGLGLNEHELTLLRQQGYLDTAKRWPAHSGYYRLRFRSGGSLRTIYLGTDVKIIDQVKDELYRLQSARRRRLQLQRGVRRAKAAFRNVKQRLSPIVFKMGYHYHGDALRKFRSLPAPSEFQTK